MRIWKILLRLALPLAVLFWLASEPGRARIVWQDYVIETSAAFLGVAFVLVALGFSFVSRFVRGLIDGPRFWRLRQKMRSMEKGQDLLARGLVAIASGDAAEAGRLAIAARKSLGQTISTRLLQAQAAQLAGDDKVASEIYRALAADPASAVLGYRGLIMGALRAKDWDEADRLIEMLKREKPSVPWINVIQFDTAVRRRRWADAVSYLSKASAARLVAPADAARREAALLVAQAKIEARHKLDDRALQSAEKALRLAPQWLPAALCLAERQIARRHERAALRLLEKTWAHAPHPDIALLSCRAARAATPIDAYKHVERLTRGTAAKPESRLLLGEYAMAADLWGEARRHLLSLVKEGKACQKTFALLAELERRENKNDRAAAGWLARLVDAAPAPRWLCAACGGDSAEWDALCPSCGGFNSLEWRIPGQSRVSEAPALTFGPLHDPLGG